MPALDVIVLRCFLSSAVPHETVLGLSAERQLLNANCQLLFFRSVSSVLISGKILVLMPIAYLTLEIRIEDAHSLKDKRHVVRSLKDRLRNSFNVSVAEIDVSDLWQRATLGVVSISDSRDYLEGLMRNVENTAVRLANNNGAEIVDSFLDYLDSGDSQEKV
jgi:uncharacterized protein YlxP (DUF503 family)